MVRIVTLLLFAAVLGRPAAALESAAVRSDRVVATLVTDVDTVAPGKPFRVGLRLRIAPGWHTYWSNPGDAGVPPELTLTLPDGASSSPIAWPAPLRLPEGPVMTYGYTGEILLPVTVTPAIGAQGATEIGATATWLVCEKICVPEEGFFRLSVPAGPGVASPQNDLFVASESRTPRPTPFEARLAPDGTLSLIGRGLSRTTIKDAWFFPAEWGPIDQAAPQKVSIADGMVQLSLHPGSAFKPDGVLNGVLVLRDPGGQESILLVQAQPGGAATTSIPIPQVLFLALVGGLVLNLMPCVFPILAMKAFAIARLSGQTQSIVRAHAVSYTAGVLTAFGGMAGVLLAVRAAGGLVGWGFQFQSPVFVAAMGWLLFAVGLNLSGVFEIGGSSAGQGLAARQGHLGSFFTGLLAVVVATPCTAPFMGVAIAAALAAPGTVTVAVFLVMGLGLAAPYALLAAAPSLARLLPRPGRWMDMLRSALAFPMYGAAAWLTWVVSLQAGPDGVLIVAAGFVLVGFAAWAYRAAYGRGRTAGRVGAVLALSAALAILPLLHTASGPVIAAADTEPFTPARLQGLRDEGRPVFVNLTAAWCVTCLVNERVALSPAAVRDAFRTRGVTYLKGDWTRGDPAITAFLREHARDGVPLYLLYPSGQGAPRVLPQILTQGEILAQLDRLGG